jgi:lactoylglutathione lyase
VGAVISPSGAALVLHFHLLVHIIASLYGGQQQQKEREGEEFMINREAYQLPPQEGFVLTYFLTVADVKRSAEFYQRVFGGTVERSGEPTIIRIANSWLILNIGGGPTDDKPEVTLHPPHDPNEVSSFLNIRVADIWPCYEEWRKRGATFLTEPKDHGVEIRCYIRDPDGYLIEVGQSVTPRSG